MDAEQAKFYHEKLLPLVRDAAEDDPTDPRHKRNPLRPMLKTLLSYVEYLEDQCR